MKKIIKFIFACLLLISVSSCNNEKFLLKGNISNETLVKVDSYTLQGMIENEESFVLVVLLKTCSTCESFKENILNPYIKETHATIYSIDLIELEGFENYKNKPYVKEAPTLLIYNKGKVKDTLKYDESIKEFKDLGKFKDYMNSFIIEPKMIEVSEDFLDNAITNKETFILYIGWNKCGDCKLLEERVINSFLLDKETNTNFYYLESDKYRSLKPKTKPEFKDDFTEEELINYNKDLENWNNWINFASKYNFESFRDGRVPTIQYYENGIMEEWIVYNNDLYENDVVVDSFFDELDGKTLSKEELLEIHDKKALEFLKKH